MERPLTAATRGVPKRASGAVNMITTTTRLVLLLILPLLSLCAPQVQKPLSDDILAPDLANPFGSSEDNRRLLQSYIKSSLKEGQTSPELNTREQEVFFLFSLYDYDRSGQMDGLELMQLLTDFLTYHEMMPQTTDSVVSLVDYLLQTEDLNQDGLLAPSELLSSSSSSTTDHQQDNNITPPDPPAEEALKQQETETKAEHGDSETHQQDAAINQESERKTETQDPTEDGDNQKPKKPEEQQLPEEQELQDDHQVQKKMPVHQEQQEM